MEKKLRYVRIPFQSKKLVGYIVGFIFLSLFCGVFAEVMMAGFGLGKTVLPETPIELLVDLLLIGAIFYFMIWYPINKYLRLGVYLVIEDGKISERIGGPDGKVQWEADLEDVSVLLRREYIRSSRGSSKVVYALVVIASEKMEGGAISRRDKLKITDDDYLTVRLLAEDIANALGLEVRDTVEEEFITPGEYGVSLLSKALSGVLEAPPLEQLLGDEKLRKLLKLRLLSEDTLSIQISPSIEFEYIIPTAVAGFFLWSIYTWKQGVPEFFLFDVMLLLALVAFVYNSALLFFPVLSTFEITLTPERVIVKQKLFGGITLRTLNIPIDSVTDLNVLKGKTYLFFWRDNARDKVKIGVLGREEFEALRDLIYSYINHISRKNL